MARRRADKKFPDRKISETFLHFAEPLLESLGPQATADEMDKLLKLAFTVWNAVVYEDAVDNRYFTEMLRNQLANDAEAAALIERLIDRKRRLFGHDHRLIGDFKLRREGDEWRLRAEARDPTSRNPDTE